MTKNVTLLLLLCLLAAPALAGGATGKVSDGKATFTIKDAVALYNPARGRLQIMLYDRPIDDSIKEELKAWDGEDELGLGSVAVLSLRKNPPKTGMPALDEDLQFVHLWVSPGSNDNPWGEATFPLFKNFSTKGGKKVRFLFKYDSKTEYLHMTWSLKVDAPIQTFQGH